MIDELVNEVVPTTDALAIPAVLDRAVNLVPGEQAAPAGDVCLQVEEAEEAGYQEVK